MREISYCEALSEAMGEEMRRDPRVVLWGLDVGPYGSAFAATQGLYEEFGPERVIDMPISEAGYVGAGVGAAITGLRPIVELQYSDWITIAMDQLVNHAAKMRYMFGGELAVPLVLRAPVGGYLSASADHSQTFEAWFAHVPGLKVVLPSTPYDAKGLLKSAIRDNNPVIFFEHKKLYAMKGPVPEEEYLIPLGEADLKREGGDATIVTYSYMVSKSLNAAERLAQEGVSVEVLDLRTIDPMDKEAVIQSVRKTGRLVVVQEAPLQCSVSSEVTSIVVERAFDDLDAPVVRVGAKGVPVPFNPDLENFVLPQEEDMIAAVKKVMGK